MRGIRNASVKSTCMTDEGKKAELSIVNRLFHWLSHFAKRKQKKNRLAKK